MKRYDVLNVKISFTDKKSSVQYLLENLDEARNSFVCCANVHTVVTGRENRDYLNILNSSFMTLPDGGPIAREGSKIDKNISKVSGVDFMDSVLKETFEKNIKHYFYGNTKQNLEKFIETVKNKYRGINICGFENSIFRELCIDEKRELKERIKDSGADIVWVALGAPRQEFFCAELCNDTNACWVAVGGAFNVMAGIIPRAPKWMRDNSLEWLYRLYKEPKRLFKRYLITNTKYIYYKLFG